MLHVGVTVPGTVYIYIILFFSLAGSCDPLCSIKDSLLLLHKVALCSNTVKTFGLLQPLSQLHACCVCHTLQTSREGTNLILNQSVVEKLLPLLN